MNKKLLIIVCVLVLPIIVVAQQTMRLGGGSISISRLGAIVLQARSDKTIALNSNTTITGTAAVSSNATVGGTLGVTGVSTASGGLSVGAGNGTLLRLSTGTASLNFTALAANTCETLTIAVTNSTTGSSVSIGIPDALADVDGATESTTFSAWVSANGTVSVRRCNVTAVVTADPAAATVRATVLTF